MKKLVTHNGKFHTDDVLAGAILAMYFKKQGELFEFIRTRDDEIIKTGNIVFDIGNNYNPDLNYYDHHQKGRAGERINGIPYAACGLIWKHFGMKLCSNEAVWQLVDEILVQGIDASDNGMVIETQLIPGIKKFTLGSVVDCYLPLEEDADLGSFDEGYVTAVEYVAFILDRTILQSEKTIQNKLKVQDLYNTTADKQIIVCEKYIQGVLRVLGDFPEPLYVIYPDQNNRWRIDAVRNPDEVYKNRKDLPQTWGGLRDEELQKISGVSDAVFCHPGLFTAGAVSQEGALKMARIALES